jgi:type I restriction enzyme M protein
MLNQETKRKIDNARQILVGKVPDPKAQVDQITTALIYKFMDDMDREAEEIGGKARFFANGFEKYSWGKLMDPKLSGHERLNLYVEAITKMSRNPHLPQLFRDIFKDAFLPFRSPETLNLFLKEINSFEYNHSEDLGNTFEYLLSIMGSQGDAGMFRTPRHIIDFMVEVVDPQKNESILDPACGTAGFLISAYKHILKNNSSNLKKTKDESVVKKGKTVEETIIGGEKFRGELLTPEERKKLMHNFVGYDISPDMVKLSLVNMYLHGFPEPKIFEYDTLSSEDRWDEMYDVIMANPPFMTPKGGIRPHKRFSIQAKRSEALFVDYILEHLNQKGRAGIIVPEGIIFKTEVAYKELRRLLIEDGLFAVVSLPSGVFNPYAGVKTSILFFDNKIAKQADNILFIKITNDGFDLGAQRRKLDNDGELPIALQVLRTYREGFEKGIGKKFKLDKSLDYIAWLTLKEKIIESGDYNLSGDRYKEKEEYKKQKWPIVELGKIADIGAGNSAPQNKKYFIDGKYPFFRTSDVGLVHIHHNLITTRDKLNDSGIKGLKLFKKGTILFPKSGASTFLNHRVVMGVDGYVSSHLATIYPNKEILSEFLFYLLCQIDAKKLTNDQSYPSLRLLQISKIKIPLPPLEVQKDILKRIKSKQEIINDAKELIVKTERERASSGQVFERLDCGWVELGKIITTINPKKKLQVKDYKKVGKYPIIDQSQDFITGWSDDKNAVTEINEPVIIFGDHTLAVKYLDKSFIQGADGIKILKVNDKLLPKFLYHYLRTEPLKSDGYKRHFSKLKRIKIPIPSLEVQKQIASQFEKQSEAVQANKQLIKVFEQQIQDEISEVWG